MTSEVTKRLQTVAKARRESWARTASSRADEQAATILAACEKAADDGEFSRTFPAMFINLTSKEVCDACARIGLSVKLVKLAHNMDYLEVNWRE